MMMRKGQRVTYTIEADDKERVGLIAKAMEKSASFVIRKILDDNPNDKILKIIDRKDLIGKV